MCIEIGELSELEGQHFIGKSFWNDDGVELVSIHDENGMWVLDCFESGAEEILKRINAYEQLQRTSKEMLKALEAVKAQIAMTLYAVDTQQEKTEITGRLKNSVRRIDLAITNAEQQGAKG